VNAESESDRAGFVLARLSTDRKVQNNRSVAITKINGAFFAPWLSFGAPDSLFAEPAPTERSLKEVAAERYGPEAEPVFLNSGQGLLFGSAEDFTRRK